jgi:hypothetical protein
MVDTATLAVYLETTPREVLRMVKAGELVPRGQWGKGSRRGRPGWFFDLDALRGGLTDGDLVADIGS